MSSSVLSPIAPAAEAPSDAPVAPVRVERTDDAALWSDLVRRSPGGTAFHDWDWLDLQAELQQVLIERLVVLAGDEPVGVVPVPRASRRSFDATWLPFPYVGPLVPAPVLADTLLALRRWQARAGLLLGRFELGPALAPGAQEALRAARCTWREDTTVLVDLTHGSLEALHAGYSSLRRRDVRRAVRDGATVRPSLPGELAGLLPEVLEEAFRAHGKPSPYPVETGERVEAWAAGRSDVALFTALVDGEPAGVQVVLGGHPTALAWVGACLRRFRDANPNVLLYQRLLEWALEQGHDAVDLCGAVDPGVLKYKLAFGGVERPYLTAESFLGPNGLRTIPAAARRLLRR